jgi:hypothetical protein
MTATTRNGFPSDVRAAAERYVLLDAKPIWLPPRSKNPDRLEWQKERLTLDDLDGAFPSGVNRNLGILNGEPSRHLQDVDLDCPEALRIAPHLLPRTGWIFGRKSAPRSHWIYRTERSLDKAFEKYCALDGPALIELRSSGSQTVYPPSVHEETGERIQWAEFTLPTYTDLDNLHRIVRQIAAACLLARHWPGAGRRDDAALALTGALVRAGWTPEGVESFIECVAEAAGDEEARKRAGKARRTAEKQAEGAKTTGWPTLAKLLGFDGDTIVGQVKEWLGISTAATPKDVPIVEVPWPDPPLDQAFYGLPGRIVRTIEPATEADAPALLGQLLTAFGSCIDRKPHWTVEADIHYGNEFLVLVGESSKARKGTSWGHVRQLFGEVEPLWATGRVKSGLSSGEGLICQVRDATMKREKTKKDGQTVYEEVPYDPGVEDKRVLFLESEFANVLKQSERQGNTLTVVMRQMWDGVSPLEALTKNSPAKSTGAHGSVIGHITTPELRRYLTETEMANGWGNRINWCCTQRSKKLPEGGQVDQDALTQLKIELGGALTFAATVGEVRRDPQARELWIESYDELSEGRPGLAGALLARGEAHVMRWAMLYALLDRSPVITADHLMAALAFWGYCQRSVYYIFGDYLGDPVADTLLQLLRSRPEGLTRTDMRDYFTRNQSSDRIGRALGLLLQHRLARYEEQKTGGRPVERWFAVTTAR